MFVKIFLYYRVLKLKIYGGNIIVCNCLLIIYNMSVYGYVYYVWFWYYLIKDKVILLLILIGKSVVKRGNYGILVYKYVGYSLFWNINFYIFYICILYWWLFLN